MKPIERIKITKNKKVRFSIASYEQPDGRLITDLKDLAQELSKWQFPEKLNFTKSGEIVLLAREYLMYREMERKALLKKRKKK